MPKIVLVPTSHIAKESLERVRKAVEKEKPDCIAVELDQGRYFSMKNEKASQREILKQLGFSTWLIYYLFKKLQDWLGKKANIFPGAEMVDAVEMAKKRGLKFALIDQDIRLTFLKIKEVGRREKLSLIWFIFKGLTLGVLASKLSKDDDMDLSKVPSKKDVNMAMGIIKKNFPSIYRILLEERNELMAKRLVKLSEMFEKVVAVLGAGHYDGVKSLLPKSVV